MDGPAGVYAVRAITQIELLAKPGLSSAERQDIEGFLATLTIVELPPEIRQEAARVRVQAGLKLPNAIIAATALVLGAELPSNDRQLLRVPGLTVTALAVSP